jgi:hypothetical protein
MAPILGIYEPVAASKLGVPRSLSGHHKVMLPPPFFTTTSSYTHAHTLGKGGVLAPNTRARTHTHTHTHTHTIGNGGLLPPNTSSVHARGFRSGIQGGAHGGGSRECGAAGGGAGWRAYDSWAATSRTRKSKTGGAGALPSVSFGTPSPAPPRGGGRRSRRRGLAGGGRRGAVFTCVLSWFQGGRTWYKLLKVL